MDKELLAFIATNSAGNKSPAHPHGFCYVPDIQTERLQALESEGHVVVGWQTPAADKSIPVKLTDSGMAAHEAPARPAATAQHPAFQMPVTIEDNVPLPPSQRFGRAPAGQGNVDRFPFNTMAIGQSFFVPGTPGADKPMHRTFSSVVSQANRKLHPKSFAIRPDKSNGIDGARVWREADLTGPRPQRARKSSQPEAQADQPFGAPASGFGGAPAAPAFGGGFPAPGMPSTFPGAPTAPTAFPAPGPGFAAPGAGVPANAWANGPSFDQPLPDAE